MRFRETSHFAHRAKDRDGSGGRRPECEWCGRPVPSRRRLYGTCTVRCGNALRRANDESRDVEHDIQESSE